MPDFNATKFDNPLRDPLTDPKPPLVGKITDTHQQARTSARSRCFTRGFHQGPDEQGLCLDCGARGGLGFKSAEQVNLEAPQGRPVHTVPASIIAHNPNATWEDLMEERGLTPEEHAARIIERDRILHDVKDAVPELTPKQATQVGEAYVQATGMAEELTAARQREADLLAKIAALEAAGAGHATTSQEKSNV